MFEFKRENLNALPQVACDEVLFELISRLETFPQKRGKEGVAYFVGDELLVKEYNGIRKFEVLDSLFELYSSEQKFFANAGYTLPKIYSYLRVPDYSVYGEQKSKFYILEERIKGREIFLNKIEDIFFKCCEFMSKEDFDNALAYPEENLNNYAVIVKNYIEDFITQNALIESLSDNEIDNFMVSLYGIFKNARFCFPDVYSDNVLLGNNGLTLIDNYMTDMSKRVPLRNMGSEKFLVSRILFLFYSNASVNKLSDKNSKASDCIVKAGKYDEIAELITMNNEFCSKALEKMLLSAKRCLKRFNDFDMKLFLKSISLRFNLLIGEERMNGIVKRIEKDF